MRVPMEWLFGDLAIFAMLVAGVAATGIAILADHAPERRRRRGAAKTEQLR